MKWANQEEYKKQTTTATKTTEATAAENKKAMEADAEKFKADNADKKATISEYTAPAEENADAQKKNSEPSSFWFWCLLIVLVAGLGLVLVRKDKK